MLTFTTRSLARRMAECHHDEAPRVARHYLRRAIEAGRVEQIMLWSSVVAVCEAMYPSKKDSTRSRMH